jgi:regulator of extracellular matrix RemA (YlzA/DUF370 family)
MDTRGMINLGFGNFVPAERVVAVINPDSSPMRRLRGEARDSQRLVDATQGRRTKAIVVTDSNHVILSSVTAETLAQRYNAARLPLGGEG